MNLKIKPNSYRHCYIIKQILMAVFPTTPTSQIKVIRTERSDDDHPSRFNQRRDSYDDFR